LMVVDGESGADQLAANNPQLPSLQAVLQGLAEQGFLEVTGSDANVVQMNTARVANGVPSYTPAQQPQTPMQAPTQAPRQPAMMGGMQQAGFSPELEQIKASMTKDVSALLGADAAPVIQKIQGCHTKNDLFAAMMGIKKIISIYTNAAAADKFAVRYQSLV
jgi:hypothetical protein